MSKFIIKPIVNNLIINQNKDNNELATLEIPREFLRILVYSIGMHSYDIDARGVFSIESQKILNNLHKQIEEQLSKDDKWFSRNF